MEEIKWPEKVTNELVIERIGERRTFLPNTLCRKVNWIGHTLRKKFLFHDVIEGEVTEVKGAGRRRTQLLMI